MSGSKRLIAYFKRLAFNYNVKCEIEIFRNGWFNSSFGVTFLGCEENINTIEIHLKTWCNAEQSK